MNVFLAPKVRKRNCKPIRIAFGALKGGVGKSFLAMNIAGYLISEYSAKVLLVVCDAQDDISDEMLQTNKMGAAIPEYDQDKHKSLADVIFNGCNLKDAIYHTREHPLVKESDIKRTYLKGKSMHLDILPAGDELFDVKVPMRTDKSGHILRNSLTGQPELVLNAMEEIFSEIENEYDFMIFDLPPNKSDITILALAYCDYVIVPVKENASIKSWKNMNYTVDMLRKYGCRIKMLGAVQNMVMPRWSFCDFIEDAFRENGNNALFRQRISMDSNKEKSSTFGIPLCAFTKTKAGHQLWKLTKEIIERINEIEKEEN